MWESLPTQKMPNKCTSRHTRTLSVRDPDPNADSDPDLNPAERLKKSESQGMRLKEALHINTSLTALGKVVMALDPNANQSHVPYRDSKLTRLLQNSLGGNSYTTLLATIHPQVGQSSARFLAWHAEPTDSTDPTNLLKRTSPPPHPTPPHTHTTHTRTRTRTRTYTLSLTHTHTHTLSPSLSLAHRRTTSTSASRRCSSQTGAALFRTSRA